MTLKVIVCEDEPLARETLRDFIADHPQLQLVYEAADGLQALAAINAKQPDVVFMDIQMPEKTGLEVIKRLQHLPQLPRIVFTTAFDQHAITAFELNAVDYLLKPFSRERFAAAVARLSATETHAEGSSSRQALEGALNEAQSTTAAPSDLPLQRILVRDRGRIFPLALAEIEYLKADTKYTLIAARGTTYLVRIPISELECKLDPARFMRIHRSAIINLDFVESMKPDDQSQLSVHMRDGTVLVANREASRALRDSSI